MPLDYGSRNLVAGNNSPYIPLVTDNPAFKVAIIPVDGRFEEKPNAKVDRKKQEDLAALNTRKDLLLEIKSKLEESNGKQTD